MGAGEAEVGSVTEVAAWFVEAVRSGLPANETQILAHFDDTVLAGVDNRHQILAEAMVRMAGLVIVDCVCEEQGFRLALASRPSGPAKWTVCCGVDASSGKITSLTQTSAGVDGLETIVVGTSRLPPDELAAVHQLFADSYQEADHGYLDGSLLRLDRISLAKDGSGLVGFALGGLRSLDLPRLGPTTVALAGLCCVRADFRRRGLFGYLANRALGAIPADADPVLSCGRMAHPASMRSMARSPGAVPRPGVVPTPWHQAVGQEVATAYGVSRFDPETFVCHGSGRPIGYPVLDMDSDIDPVEWSMFDPVDRSQGDSLLAVAWATGPPAGW